MCVTTFCPQDEGWTEVTALTHDWVFTIFTIITKHAPSNLLENIELKIICQASGLFPIFNSSHVMYF